MTKFVEGQSGNPDGLPSTYNPAYAAQAKKLCELGATDNDLIDFFQCSRATLYRWKIQFRDFGEAIVDGKEKADARVIRALYNKATGYSFDSEKIFCKDGIVTRVQTVEHIPPSDAAIKIWLAARCGWTEKSQIEHIGKDGGPIEMITSAMTAKEAAERYREELG